MMERTAEAVDVEKPADSVAVAYSHFVKVGEVLIDLDDVFFFREGVGHPLFKFLMVALVVE